MLTRHGCNRIPILLLWLLVSLVLSASIAAQDFFGMATFDDVTLFFPAPGDDGQAGAASYYDIRYANEPLTESNWSSAFQVDGEPIPKEAGAIETIRLTGLDDGMTYYFGIKAADECFNWSAVSPNIIVTTPEAQSLMISEMTMVNSVGKTKDSRSKLLVWVVDQHGEPVPSATVTVEWWGPREEIQTGVTDQDGEIVFTSPLVAAARAYWCATIAEIEAGVRDQFNPSAQEILTVCDESLGAKEERPEYDLSQNFPNPFNPETEIGFNLPEPAHVSLIVYNVLGQEITVLVDQTLPAGLYSFPWNAGKLPTGVYFYRLQANDYVQTRKMVLVK